MKKNNSQLNFHYNKLEQKVNMIFNKHPHKMEFVSLGKLKKKDSRYISGGGWKCDARPCVWGTAQLQGGDEDNMSFYHCFVCKNHDKCSDCFIKYDSEQLMDEGDDKNDSGLGSRIAGLMTGYK